MEKVKAGEIVSDRVITPPPSLLFLWSWRTACFMGVYRGQEALLMHALLQAELCFSEMSFSSCLCAIVLLQPGTCLAPGQLVGYMGQWV
ncbi:hypothetical protein C0J50_11550 [Silurus asotus]|uniref:Uncharacterized protein n=1 Tax=Silurus asotus TaxID=30991 RepID=A0AAD5AC38_SILAS|nr:hypothetical protein C0J50_11550 [Silurus asotus]